jgi:hypothetical protein
MERTQGPLYSGPMFPIGSLSKNLTPPQRLMGRIVDVRTGRSDETGSTQILTIKLTQLDLDDRKLLDRDVEILVRPHS